MIEDDEGFVYPKVNQSDCINCHLCERVCPIINVRNDRSVYIQEGYIVQNKDSEILRESTAGGAFTAIAEYVIENEGFVFGVEMQDNLYTHPSAAHHIWTDKIQDLRKFRNSKYIQSFVGGVH